MVVKNNENSSCFNLIVLLVTRRLTRDGNGAGDSITFGKHTNG